MNTNQRKTVAYAKSYTGLTIRKEGKFIKLVDLKRGEDITKDVRANFWANSKIKVGKRQIELDTDIFNMTANLLVALESPYENVIRALQALKNRDVDSAPRSVSCVIDHEYFATGQIDEEEIDELIDLVIGRLWEDREENAKDVAILREVTTYGYHYSGNRKRNEFDCKHEALQRIINRAAKFILFLQHEVCIVGNVESLKRILYHQLQGPYQSLKACITAHSSDDLEVDIRPLNEIIDSVLTIMEKPWRSGSLVSFVVGLAISKNIQATGEMLTWYKPEHHQPRTEIRQSLGKNSIW